MQAVEDITNDSEFRDLHKFQLEDHDWATLEDYQEILQVCHYFCLVYYTDKIYQVPHAFQDILGAETTPTLCYAIPAYSAFIDLWKKQIEDYYQWEPIIQPGIDKLEDYQGRLNDSPAYVVAMGKSLLDILITKLMCEQQLIPQTSLNIFVISQGSTTQLKECS